MKLKPLFSKTNLKRNIDVKRKLIKAAMFSIVFAFIALGVCASHQYSDTKTGIHTAGAGIAGFMFLGARQLSPDPQDGPDDVETKALLEKVKKVAEKESLELKKKIEALEAKATTDATEIKSFKDKLEKLEAKKLELKEVEEFKTLATEFATLAIEFKAVKEKGITKEEKIASFGAMCLKELTEKKDAILASLKDGKPYNMEVKIDSVTEDNTIFSGDTAISLTQNTGIVSTIRKRILKYLQNVSVGGITTATAMWIEEFGEDGQPIFVHEAIGKPQAIVKYVEKTERVKKIAVFGKMSTEWMSDLPQLVNYLQNNLAKRLDIKTEDKLFNGAGGTGSDDPLGILVNASAFTGGSLAGKVTRPNAADVIRAIALQVEEAYGMANAIFVHPGVLAELDTIKTTEGLYVRPFWANGELIAGVRVISTLTLAPNEFVGGDLSVMNVLFREGLNVRIGEVGDDFTDNKKTIVLEQRLVQFISANDYLQIVKGNFSDAADLLEAVSS